MPRRQRCVWLLVAAGLVIWNGVAALAASPLHLVHASDTTQYHLLARNRLSGHGEVGDSAHTVRDEGLHPVWRPGFVWITESFAKPLGSVRSGAIAASLLGTTLVELVLLCLTVRCFGEAAAALVGLTLIAPLPVGSCFLLMAIGQGPEPWSALFIVSGLTLLVEALRRCAWAWAFGAGAAAGFAEWFRTGNHLLFAVPCAFYGIAALKRRDLRGFGLPALAGGIFLFVMALGGRLVPSSVDKTTVNLWQRVIEFYGDKITNFENTPITLHLGGIQIVEGTTEDYYDYTVSRSRNLPAGQFFVAHAAQIAAIYWHGLRDIVWNCAAGLRSQLGNLVFLCFAFQVFASIAGRTVAVIDSLALAGGALAHLFIPTALLRGDEPTHYLYVAMPLFLAVAAAGAAQLGHMVLSRLMRWRPVWHLSLIQARGFIVALSLTPVLCLSGIYYVATLRVLHRDLLQAQREQSELDALQLDGLRVCCRNMNWFVDRNVRTVFLPYANVRELAYYARGQNCDGILVCDNETQPLFRVTPYESPAQFETALASTPWFGLAQVSGAWRWFPVLRTSLPTDSTGARGHE